MISPNARTAGGRSAMSLTLLWAGLVFILALLPRLVGLGDFLTIDEVKWAEGAAQFLLALQSGRLAETYWHFHPGITITWGSALFLWAACLPQPELAACATSRVADLAGVIGWLRLSPVLLTSAGIAGVYLAGRRLAGQVWALLAALLLAFDPFFVGHSRILNGDAGAAILMFLSLLAFLNYGSQFRAKGPLWAIRNSQFVIPNSQFPIHNSQFTIPPPWLLLSGILAGLAWLTKLPSPLIGVFVAGLCLVAIMLSWNREGPAAARRWLAVLAAWTAVAAITFVLLWPAMWVAPLQTLRLMVADSFNVGEVGSGHDTFFLGQLVTDPGPWFYPVVIGFRLTPVVLAGLLAATGWLILRPIWRTGPPQGQPPGRERFQAILAWLLLAFVVVIILLANLSPKKLDRYVMSVIPALLFVAALGLVKISQLLRPAYRPAGLGGLVFVQLLFAVVAAPYYLTYYNPLLGGVRSAAGRIPVGWGEGLEQAATYLNNLPEAETLVVSSWYSDIFNPYFVGQRASFSDDGRSQLAADYVVFYVNQVQRQKPYPGLVDYFRAGQPVFTVTAGSFGQRPGVPWVEVYRAPAAQSAGGAPSLEGVAQLLAYKVTGSRVVSQGDADHRVTNGLPDLAPADEVRAVLFLRVLGPLPPGGSRLSAALLSPAAAPGLAWPETGAGEIRGAWREGQIVEWHGPLALPLPAPPGEYRLRIQLRAEDGRALAELPVSDKDPPIVLGEAR